jgi:hypothetical protein
MYVNLQYGDGEVADTLSVMCLPERYAGKTRNVDVSTQETALIIRETQAKTEG